MGQVTMIKGTVSGVRVDSSITVNTSTNVTVNEGGMPNQSSSSSETVRTNTTVFRIDNKPSYMPFAINITNGDAVTAAGLQKGEFEVVAINNHTTKTIYFVPKPSIVPEFIYMFIGFCFRNSYGGIGWLFIGGAILFMVIKSVKIKRIKDACAMVDKAQAPAKN